MEDNRALPLTVWPADHLHWAKSALPLGKVWTGLDPLGQSSHASLRPIGLAGPVLAGASDTLFSYCLLLFKSQAPLDFNGHAINLDTHNSTDTKKSLIMPAWHFDNFFPTSCVPISILTTKSQVMSLRASSPDSIDAVCKVILPQNNTSLIKVMVSHPSLSGKSSQSNPLTDPCMYCH